MPRVHLQNLRVKASFPSEFFKVKFSSRNGTYHIVETLFKGITHIDATLASVQKEVGMSGKADDRLFKQWCPLVYLSSSMNSTVLPDTVYVVVCMYRCTDVCHFTTSAYIYSRTFVLSPRLSKKLVVPIGLFEQFDEFICVT